MNKEFLLEKVQSGNFTQEKLIGWLNAMPSAKSTRKPIKDKVGDVYMHPIFGHPYVLLRKKKNYWICGLITSEPTCTEILEPTQSRFFPDNFFTRVCFTQTVPLGSFMNAYDNQKHLKSITTKLKDIMS